VKLEFDERDRQSALGDLTSLDAEVRRLAVERSVALPVDEAIGVLVDRLGDPSWRVRKAAVERLIAMPDPQAWVARLIAALGDAEDPGRRNAAVEALVHGGRRVVSDLVAAIGSHDAGVRKLLIDTLAEIADPGSEAVLVAALSDPDANVRAAAAEALGALGGAAAQRALRECAAQGDEDRLVRLAALRSLATLDAQVPARELCPLLDDAILRPAALDLLGRSDDAVAPVLLKWLGSESRVSRMAAVRSLLLRIARSDDAEAALLVETIREQAASLPAADDAIATLASPDLGARLVAMQFLGIVRAPRAVVPILRAVRDDALRDVGLSTLEEFGPLAEAELDAAWSELDLAARCDACRLFARTRGAQSAERLLAALEDPAGELRAEAERAVGRRRLATALPALLRRLEAISGEDDPEADEEVAAVTEALCDLAAPVTPGAEIHPEAHAILDALTSRLGGAPEPVLLAIAHVLGRAGRPSDAGAMIRLLEDPSAPVRRAAVVALARLDGAATSEPLRLALADESASVRIAAASALGSSESDADIADLERLADDRDPRVRAVATRGIGRHLLRCTDHALRVRALARLDAALGDAGLVALAAVEALREIGGPAARGVSRILQRPEPELLKEAVVCLAAHGEAGDFAAIVPLVAHAEWSVRAQAVAALAERRVVSAVPAILRRVDVEQDLFVRAEMLRALERLEG
jgi:HEAT repeat protein